MPVRMSVDRLPVDALCQEILHYTTLTERVIDQTCRRIFASEAVPAEQKLYSLFEPHTDLIKRGKARKPVEFGHKVFLAESRVGLITNYRVLRGNPPDSDQVAASLDYHRQLFARAPELYAADRGFDHPAARALCESTGVVELCIPQRGGKLGAARAAIQHSRRFKAGQRYRAGIEGTISVLLRGRGGTNRARRLGSRKSLPLPAYYYSVEPCPRIVLAPMIALSQKKFRTPQQIQPAVVRPL